MMDGCFERLSEAIHRYEGTINQFTGDGIMALFGAPIAHEDHAERAIHSALAIQAAMSTYGATLARERTIEFRMRIGLNSGTVVVGKIGDNLRMDYTAQGDTVNLAGPPGAGLPARRRPGQRGDAPTGRRRRSPSGPCHPCRSRARRRPSWPTRSRAFASDAPAWTSRPS